MPTPVDALIEALNVAAKETTETLDQALKPLGLTASNYYFLLKIGQQPTVSQDQLYQLLHLTPSNVTRRLAQLSAQGLVTKQRDPHDGRAWVTALTPAGRALLPRLTQTLAAVNARTFAGLGASQQATLMTALQRVSQNLQA